MFTRVKVGIVFVPLVLVKPLIPEGAFKTFQVIIAVGVVELTVTVLDVAPEQIT